MFIPTCIIPIFLHISVFCYGYKGHQTTPLLPEPAERTLLLALVQGLCCDLCPLGRSQIGSDDGAGNQALYGDIQECGTRGKSCKNNLWEELSNCIFCIKICLWLCPDGNCNCWKYCKPVSDVCGGKSPVLYLSSAREITGRTQSPLTRALSALLPLPSSANQSFLKTTYEITSDIQF